MPPSRFFGHSKLHCTFCEYTCYQIYTVVVVVIRWKYPIYFDVPTFAQLTALKTFGRRDWVVTLDNSNMHEKFGKDTKTSELITPTR